MYARADHQRIHNAIAAARRLTRGEVHCVVVQESGSYREVPVAWAAAVGLLGAPLALIAGARPTGLVDLVRRLLNGGWHIGHAGPANAGLMAALLGYTAIQLILFGAALALVSVPAVRRLATPGRLKTARVHAKALEHFAGQTHSTEAPAAVMVFASLAERRVEIIADENIHAKVGDAAWNQAVAKALAHIRTGDVAGGLVLASELCGEALAAHFPPNGGVE